jgi:hypothetical protein
LPRKNASRHETIFSISILLLLVIIASVFFIEQSRFSPAIIPLTNELDPGKPGQTDHPAPSVASGLQLPKELIPLSDPEHYDSRNLSDKIDGKADFYLQAGFVRLETRRFQIKFMPDEWMELFIYEMDRPSNAFSVFSLQRRTGSKTSQIAQNAYQTPNAIFFTHGPYYVEMILSQESQALRKAADSLGRGFIQSVTVRSDPVDGGFLFPKKNLRPDSLELIPANAFGFEKLNHVWVSGYEINNMHLNAFVSRRDSIREAEFLTDSYSNFLKVFGGEEIPMDASTGIKIFKISDIYEVFFSQGIFFGGIHQAEDRSSAETLAIDLKRHLRGMKGGT